MNKLFHTTACLLFLLLSGCFQKPDTIASCPQLNAGKYADTHRPIIFLPGITGRYKPKKAQEGKRVFNPRGYGSRAGKKRNLTLQSGPAGLSIDEYGVLEWNPSISTPAGHYQASFINRDSEINTPIFLELSVLPTRIVEGVIDGRYFKVTDEESGLFGYVFEFEDVVSANHVVLREIPKGCLPDQEYFHHLVSSGFYLPPLSDVDFNLYVPEKKVHRAWWKSFNSTRTDAHFWTDNYDHVLGIAFDQHWSNSFKSHGKTVQMGESYVPFKRMSGNGLTVIGLSQYDNTYW